MSAVNINRSTLNKLTDESIEIRLRTLEQLSSKFNRSLELNGTIEVKAGDLCKQLIRWFGFLPPQQPLIVLKLLKSIIESSKYGSEAIEKLGTERLAKELRKIQTLFDCGSEEYEIINNMKDFLKNAPPLKEISEIGKKTEDLEHETGSANKMKTEVVGYSLENYETPRLKPSPSDYTSMKFLSDILANRFSSKEEIENAVCHLQITMADYPFEYLLQPPHIFQNLLLLYDERKRSENQNFSVDRISSSLLQFLFILEKQHLMSRKSTSFNQVSSETSSAQGSEKPCQLKIEKALREIFEASVFHLELHAPRGASSPAVWEVIFKTLTILGIIKKSLDITCLRKVASVVANLSTKLTQNENCERLRLQQMLLIFLLQDAAVMNICPDLCKALEIIEPILRDYAIKHFFEKRHQLMKSFVIEADNSLDIKYQLLKLYERSFDISTQMLKKKLDWSCIDIIKEGKAVCTILHILQSRELIHILFDGVIRGIPLYRENNQIKVQAIDLIHKLLNSAYIPLKEFVYEKLSDAFKRHIGCLMTGERYALECSNADLLKAKIIGVPLSTDLLIQLVHDSSESTSNQIKSNCCKIIELLFKSQSLYHTHWSSILSMVLPVLPLLNCCTFSEEIMDLLLNSLDPDLRQLPFIYVLQGNIGFLFHSHAARRSEALTRLIYTLSSLKDAEKYMPNLLEISDTLPNDICLQNTPQEYQNIFKNSLPVRCDLINSLNNLLRLLESPDVEPLLRKTILMQINILCSNWHITAEVCSSGALYLILQALENALQKSSELDYADSAVPAIGILSKVVLYDSSVRCELSETPNIYVLILRALLMFHHDIQVRQDATLCLFLLIFQSYIVSTENSVEGPFILEYIKKPLKVTPYYALSDKIHQETINLSKMFNTTLEETQYWRMVVASCYCGGLKNVTQKSISALSKLDIREDLKLRWLDVQFIRATQPSVSLRRLVKTAMNATDHRSLIHVCQLLKQQLIVPTFKNTFSVNDSFCEEINSIFRRYLQMPPGNEKDLDLYENLLDVAKICLKVPLELVALDILKSVHKDSRHALITILTEGEEIPLRIYNKIATLLELLINENHHFLENSSKSAITGSFLSKLFDLFIERCLQLFEVRDLQRVRCLLSLIVAISAFQQNMPDELSFFYCRRFVQLSLALKSFTQTGSQWHRDCLLIILHLYDQMQNSNENFRLSKSFVKYISGLCGHNDVEVRTLAWSILNIVAKTAAIDSRVTERKEIDISGTELLINELSYLPGGLMACCLSTLLDTEEAMSVRYLAGQLLGALIQKRGQIKDIEKLLESHNFMRLATEALCTSACVFDIEVPIFLYVSTTKIATYDLISCYSLICIVLSQRFPSFLNDLCTKSFMFKLYEVLKQPPPTSKHIGYSEMVGHICRLYTLCYTNNFIFLQRTICRDAAWLEAFCAVLFGIIASSSSDYVTFHALQLFIILCKDSIALEQLSLKLQYYSSDIVKLFQNVLNIKNLGKELQSCALSFLSFLLIKSQSEINTHLGFNMLNVFENQNVTIKYVQCSGIFECDNKENSCNNKKEAILKDENHKSSISEHICFLLIRLFNHLYPAVVCKFSTPPNLKQQNVTETLALLLKQSVVAQETAQKLKLPERVLTIFKNFFEETATTSSTAYVKRNGENKKLAAIKNLQLLLKLLLCWYSSPATIITDNMLAMGYCKIIIQIWSWLSHSNGLKLTVLQLCSFLSERSLVVCKQFSTLNNGPFPHSVLQLVTKMVTSETLKIKAKSTDCGTVITDGLRVLINCCSCLEGRNTLNKMHALKIFDTLYPFNPKTSQSKKDIVYAWLELWELFSRYDEGAQSHHLNALCSVVNKSSRGCPSRLISLRILRNMAFLNKNRSALIASTDFTFTVNEIISQPIKDSVEEQFIICVALWKLISGGIKFVSMIRATKLAKNLRLLRENLLCNNDERNENVKFSNDVLNVLNIIFKIFNN